MRRQPFRRSVDRRRETGRSGADDRHVIDSVGSIGRTRPMQRASSVSLGLRSICPFGHSTMGSSRGSTWKRSMRSWRSRRCPGSSRWCGWPLRREEILPAAARRHCRRADDDRPAGAALEQTDAAQDQRPHDALAELGFRHQNRAAGEGMTSVSTASSHAHRRATAGRRAARVRPRTRPGPCVTMGWSRVEQVCWLIADLPAREDEHARADVAARDERSPAA